MAKRVKPKHPAKPGVEKQLANAFALLRALRDWEDHVLRETERLCGRFPRGQRSKPHSRTGPAN